MSHRSISRIPSDIGSRSHRITYRVTTYLITALLYRISHHITRITCLSGVHRSSHQISLHRITAGIVSYLIRIVSQVATPHLLHHSTAAIAAHLASQKIACSTITTAHAARIMRAQDISHLISSLSHLISPDSHHIASHRMS